MKTARKAILLVMCAVLLVAASVMGTLAYFTDSEAVTNTFTIGKVGIDMDEAKVDVYGDAVAGADRVKENTYKLVPGRTYIKDPIVYIDAESESSYVFVKVENSIAKIEAATTIHDQIISNEKGWTELTVSGVTDTTNDTTVRVYYKLWDKTADADDRNLEVFDTFKIDGDNVVNVPANGTAPEGKYNIADYNGDVIKVTAYAIQEAGFENDPSAAWTALTNQLTNS